MRHRTLKPAACMPVVAVTGAVLIGAVSTACNGIDTPPARAPQIVSVSTPGGNPSMRCWRGNTDCYVHAPEEAGAVGAVQLAFAVRHSVLNPLALHTTRNGEAGVDVARTESPDPPTTAPYVLFGPEASDVADGLGTDDLFFYPKRAPRPPAGTTETVTFIETDGDGGTASTAFTFTYVRPSCRVEQLAAPSDARPGVPFGVAWDVRGCKTFRVVRYSPLVTPDDQNAPPLGDTWPSCAPGPQRATTVATGDVVEDAGDDSNGSATETLGVATGGSHSYVVYAADALGRCTNRSVAVTVRP